MTWIYMQQAHLICIVKPHNYTFPFNRTHLKVLLLCLSQTRMGRRSCLYLESELIPLVITTALPFPLNHIQLQLYVYYMCFVMSRLCVFYCLPFWMRLTKNVKVSSLKAYYNKWQKDKGCIVSCISFSSIHCRT